MDETHLVGAIGRLTVREREVLQELVNGHGPQQLAEVLYISPHTAKTHVRNILQKMGAHSILEAVSLAVGDGIFPVRSS